MTNESHHHALSVPAASAASIEDVEAELARYSADALRAQEGIRETSLRLLMRRVAAASPGAAGVELDPEPTESGVRVGGCSVYAADGCILKTYDGDDEDGDDEEIIALAECVTPEAGTKEWFDYVSGLETIRIPLLPEHLA